MAIPVDPKPRRPIRNGRGGVVKQEPQKSSASLWFYGVGLTISLGCLMAVLIMGALK